MWLTDSTQYPSGSVSSYMGQQEVWDAMMRSGPRENVGGKSGDTATERW